MTNAVTDHSSSWATPTHAAERSAPTRQHVLESVLARGPVSASDLASGHGLTPAGVRRHLDALAAAGLVREAPAPATRGRGRPARRWVATAAAQAAGASYDAVALDALEALAAEAGPAAVERFALRRADRAVARYAPAVAAAGPALSDRVQALGRALSADGYAASTSAVRGSLQLCQGHCPVHAVAQAHPVLCDAETQAFSRLLGVPLRRLATIAAGSHACTTHISTARFATQTSPAQTSPAQTSTDHRPARQEGMDRA